MSETLFLDKEELKKLYHLLNDLGWEWQRMSTSGQETLNKIYAMLEIPEYHEEDSISVMDMKEDVKKHLYGEEA